MTIYSGAPRQIGFERVIFTSITLPSFVAQKRSDREPDQYGTRDCLVLR